MLATIYEAANVYQALHWACYVYYLFILSVILIGKYFVPTFHWKKWGPDEAGNLVKDIQLRNRESA